MAAVSMSPSPERFVQARTEAGLTQEELATKAGCSVFSIGKYERGERSPRGPRLRRLAEATGKPLAFFFETELVA
jgi:HTH-type transcriptional regulator, cell division transcriptional repressor